MLDDIITICCVCKWICNDKLQVTHLAPLGKSKAMDADILDQQSRGWLGRAGGFFMVLLMKDEIKKNLNVGKN